MRIFSYLSNPRVWKALIAADLCGVEVEVVGAPPPELGTWLWDYDARALSTASVAGWETVRAGGGRRSPAAAAAAAAAATATGRLS